jgi:glycosyltransferase involved in cell wall biosynthesis
MHRPLAEVVARLPATVGRGLAYSGLQGRLWTALRMNELVALRHATFRAMASEVDHIVAVCQWVEKLLLLNNVPAEKVSVSRHGVNWTSDQDWPTRGSREPSDETRIAFLGRLDPTKGLHVVVKALQAAPKANIKLDIYGVVQGPGGAAYQRQVKLLARGDSRISFQESIRPDQVVPLLRNYDFLAVPSQWMETGPLVVLEAFAAGTPVLGWNIGGVSELVRDGIDGLLIDPGRDWTETLARVAEDPNLRAKLRAGVRPPRSNIDVAREMLALYESVLRRTRPHASNQIECTEKSRISPL